MEPKELALALAEVLHDRQAEDIVLLDVEQLVGYTSYFLVASGRNERQVRALADTLERAGRNSGIRPIGREGVEKGHWALIDYGDVVVHLFRNDERNFYDLESLWGEAPRELYPEPEARAE